MKVFLKSFQFSRAGFSILILLSTVSFAQAQVPGEVIPQGIEALRQTASSKTEFTLDHSMLVFASKIDSSDEDLRRVIAGVSGVSVHNYRFHDAWNYDPEALRSVTNEYHAAGWKQVVDDHEKGGRPGATNLWLHMENHAVSGVAVLVARANEVTLVEVSGAISPMDLVHLGGHFGIPKIEGGVMVPNGGQ
jgi:hypothetical protein